MTQILTSNQTLSSVSTGIYNLTSTFLEYGKNNRIYGISPTINNSGGQPVLTSTELVGIAVSNNALSATNLGVDSRYNIGLSSLQTDIHTLPDQIDGENYNYLNGLPYVTVADITINNTAQAPICDEGFPVSDVCQNQSINLNATYSGGVPAQYRIEIYSIDVECSRTTVANSIGYVGPWIRGIAPANLDLRTLTDANGKNLSNCNSGQISIIYSVRDACGNVSSKQAIINLVVPVPVSLALQIYDYNNPQTYLNPSQNIANPVNVGAASLGFRINNSTGNITNLTVKIEEVNSTTGAPVKLIYNVTSNVNGVSGLTYVNLNNYCIPASVWSPVTGLGVCSGGYTGYFSYTNGQLSFNRYFKLTVTVGNQCSSSTNSSFLYINSQTSRFMSPAAQTEENNSTTNFGNKYFAVFPNPSSNSITFEMDVEQKEDYRIEIIDPLGRVVKTVMQSTTLEKGDFSKTVDISELTNGIYFYNINSITGSRSGIITKQ